MTGSMTGAEMLRISCVCVPSRFLSLATFFFFLNSISFLYYHYSFDIFSVYYRSLSSSALNQLGPITIVYHFYSFFLWGGRGQSASILYSFVKRCELFNYVPCFRFLDISFFFPLLSRLNKKQQQTKIKKYIYIYYLTSSALRWKREITKRWALSLSVFQI